MNGKKIMLDLYFWLLLELVSNYMPNMHASSLLTLIPNFPCVRYEA